MKNNPCLNCTAGEWGFCYHLEYGECIHHKNREIYMKKFFRIGIHHIQVDHETNSLILTGRQGTNFELKVINNNSAEVKNLNSYRFKENGGHKETITEEQFMDELREVLMLAETKGMELCNQQFFNEIINES
jgi:hypothetical protein